jgi:hypothetical protein
MSILNKDTRQIPFIRELCKHKTEEEIRRAEDNFREYLLLVKRISDRMEEEKTDDTT